MTTKVVFTLGGANPYTPGTSLIELRQVGEGRNAMFAVLYGAQLDQHLTYSRACDKLGEAIMHNLACESLISNEGK